MLGGVLTGQEPLATLEWTPFLSSDIWREERDSTNHSMRPAPRKCEFEPPRLSTVINTVLSIMIGSYDMMKECWDGEPWKRPSFSLLVTLISTSLERMAGYLDLSEQ